ncbi:MAG: arylsulfatase [Planctomycetaceae bacterium]|jgi:arylsulfatase A-like enzyme|nr:arylsulfatase [Planctomycetaceae bacterium]
MRWITVICTAVLIFCGSFGMFTVGKSVSAAQEERIAAKPNIIYIMADDLGYGDLSSYGQTLFETPRIDSLAKEGLKFTQHYAGCTVCAPSRCALMTGKHTGHSFIRGNRRAPDGFGDWPIAPEVVTVAEILKKHGYTNGLFGKWGLGSHQNEGNPLKHGFDEFFGYYSQSDAHNYYPPYLHHNDRKIELDRETYSHDLIAAEALRFIRENKARPFFCYLPFTIPHAAMQVPEEYVTPWREKFAEFEDVSAKYSSADPVKNPVAAFPGMLNKLDETVGNVLDLLKELEIEDNTIVIFTSDNGPHHEGGHRSDLFNSNGPLTGYKRDLTEGGIRVPFLVRWPAKIKQGKQGTVTGHMSAFWDFFPTVCELVGEPVPEGLDGISYLPTLLGNDSQQKKHDYLYWEFYEQGGKRAARIGDWKGIQLDVSKNPDGPIAVYHLQYDIAETNDLAKQHPEWVERFRKCFEAAHLPSDIFIF